MSGGGIVGVAPIRPVPPSRPEARLCLRPRQPLAGTGRLSTPERDSSKFERNASKPERSIVRVSNNRPFELCGITYLFMTGASAGAVSNTATGGSEFEAFCNCERSSNLESSTVRPSNGSLRVSKHRKHGVRNRRRSIPITANAISCGSLFPISSRANSRSPARSAALC
jgi:hypothetical protein